MADVWGAIYEAQWSGATATHEIERDDGRVETFESAGNYFSGPRSDAELELLTRLEGPVLDLAAGAGSYTLYLQNKGLQVIAADSSPGALEVCRARGCRDVVSMDLRAVEIAPNSLGSVIVMGNTLGAHQSPSTLPALLGALSRGVRLGGRLLFTMIDPLDTTDASHLRYQQKNREQGTPPGLIRMRLRYGGIIDEWMTLWMLTDEELLPIAAGSGWSLMQVRRRGPWRVRLFEKSNS